MINSKVSLSDLSPELLELIEDYQHLTKKNELQKNEEINMRNLGFKLLTPHFLELKNIDQIFEEEQTKSKAIKNTTFLNVKFNYSEQMYSKIYDLHTAQITYIIPKYPLEESKSKTKKIKEDTEIIEYVHTIRVSKSTKVKEFDKYVIDYWNCDKDIVKLHTDKLIKQKTIPVTNLATKLTRNSQNNTLNFTLNHQSVNPKYIEKRLNIPKTQLTSGENMNFERKFDKQLPGLSGKYFNIKRASEKNKLKNIQHNKDFHKNVSDNRITDKHYLFSILLVTLTIMRLFIIVTLYQDTNSLPKHFTKYLSTFNYCSNVDHNHYEFNSIYSFNTTDNIIDYVKHQFHPNFKNEYYNRGNFQYLSPMALRTVRNKNKTCAKPSALLYNDHCTFVKYEGAKKKFNPIDLQVGDYSIYKVATDSKIALGEKKASYLSYGGEIENKIFSNKKGVYSNFDGSGYLLLLDQENHHELKHLLRSLRNIDKYYLNHSTKAVIINFNLYYKPMRVNTTASITFELSPIGNFITHKIDVEIFIQDYFNNIRIVYFYEIVLIFINFVMVFMFINLLLDLTRSEFFTYLFCSQSGILNILDTGLTIFLTINFIKMQTSSSAKIDSMSSTVGGSGFYEDFSVYVGYYNYNILLSRADQVVKYIKMMYLVNFSRRVNFIVDFVSDYDIGFIFVILLFGAIVQAFAIMFVFHIGPYEQNYNSVLKAFYSMVIFTSRRSVFERLDHFTMSAYMIYTCAYIILQLSLWFFIMVVSTQIVRYTFMYIKEDYVDLSKWSFFKTLKRYYWKWFQVKKNDKQVRISTNIDTPNSLHDDEELEKKLN